MNRQQRYALVFWLMAVLPLNGIGQSVSARLDREAYEVGDEIRLTLSVDLIQVAEVEWPDLTAPLPGMELIADRTDTTEGQLQRRLSYLQFDSGRYVLPAFPMALLRGQDTSRLATAAIPFTVGLVAVDTTAAIRPISDRQDVDYKPIPWLMYGFFAVLFLVLCAFLFYRYYWSRRPRRVVVQALPPEPPKPADVHALDRLSALEARRLWQQDDLKPYYVELSDIVREYVEGRFSEPALESTTEEILLRMQQRELNAEQRESLAWMLRLADTVKFAKARPLSDQHQRALADARLFVEQTRPAGAEPAPLRPERQQEAP